MVTMYKTQLKVLGAMTSVIAVYNYRGDKRQIFTTVVSEVGFARSAVYEVNVFPFRSPLIFSNGSFRDQSSSNRTDLESKSKLN